MASPCICPMRLTGYVHLRRCMTIQTTSTTTTTSTIAPQYPAVATHPAATPHATAAAVSHRPFCAESAPTVVKVKMPTDMIVEVFMPFSMGRDRLDRRSGNRYAFAGIGESCKTSRLLAGSKINMFPTGR
jgi:hypothetical protein